MEIAHFSGREILQIAIQIEKNGIEFYTAAGKAAKSDKVKDLFSFLVDEEKKHIGTFEGMMKALTDERLSGKYDPYLEEEAMYIKALSDSRVFTKPGGGKRLSSSAQAAEDVLRVAMDMEKDSILFYYEMLKATKEQDKHAVEDVISEEKKHFVKLQTLYKEFTSQEQGIE